MYKTIQSVRLSFTKDYTVCAAGIVRASIIPVLSQYCRVYTWSGKSERERGIEKASKREREKKTGPLKG